LRGVCFYDFAELHALRQIAVNRLSSASNRLTVNISQDHFVPRGRRHLGNAMAHRTCAQHTDSANERRGRRSIIFARVYAQFDQRNVELRWRSGQGLASFD
jgi:hypothetical protein